MRYFILLISFFVIVNNSASQVFEWYGTQLLKEIPFKPEKDSGGYKWSDYLYNDIKWSPITKLPDGNWDCDQCDRYYRGHIKIDVDDLNENEYYLKIESDDGIWLYVNGKYLGHWGGDMHQSGCVNRCGNNEKVAPLYITDLLFEGENVVAAHVSDSNGQEYFNLQIMTKVRRRN